MSEDNDDFEDDGTVDSPQGKDWQQVRKELKELRKFKTEAEANLTAYQDLQKQEVFRQAGIDPTDAKFKYFIKGYDGELSAEALKTEAEAAGLLQPAAPQVEASELQAHTRMDQAAAGAQVVGSGDDADLINKINDPALTQAEVVALYQRMGWVPGTGR